MNSDDIILSQYPRQLTVGQVKQLLTNSDAHSRIELTELILHRLRDRYITPLEKVPPKYKSGFLMMAGACLMIETFQCFKEGIEDSNRNGRVLFERFFSYYQKEFNGLDGTVFYINIRCGILHQAQTYGHFRILRKGPVFDNHGKSINATAFLKVLRRIVETYVQNLRDDDMNSTSWTNARKKIQFIIKAIETAKPTVSHSSRPPSPLP